MYCIVWIRTVQYSTVQYSTVVRITIKSICFMTCIYDTNQLLLSLNGASLDDRYHVAWSPCLPAVVSACSFDRKVQFYSMAGAKSRIGRAPKWLKKPLGATFGFGGKLISFDCGVMDPNSSDAKGKS